MLVHRALQRDRRKVPKQEMAHISRALCRDNQIHKKNNKTIFVGCINEWNFKASYLDVGLPHLPLAYPLVILIDAKTY